MSCYIPLKDDNGKIIGGLAADISQNDIVKKTFKMIFDLQIITLVLCGIMVIVSYTFIKKKYNKAYK